MIRPMTLRLASAVLILAVAPVGAALSADARFTLVTVGDLIQSRPESMLAKPGAFAQWQRFADTLKLLKNSDLTYGNLETTIMDIRTFKGAPYSDGGDWTLSSVPAVADDLKAMGISLVSRANNHALDWGLDGMRETTKWIAQAGLIGAGVGENLSQATSAAFVQTPAGRVAIVSMASTFRAFSDALPVSAQAPFGRPGVDALHVSDTTVLDAASYKQVLSIACSFGGANPCPASSSVSLFGNTIRAARKGERPFIDAYVVNAQDRERIAGAIAAAKSQGAKFVIATIHTHEALDAEMPPHSWQDPAAFLRPLAHRLIDAGADAFVTTGTHHIAGIEIYQGKPIFYGLSSFFWSEIQDPMSGEVYESIAGDFGSSQALLTGSFRHSRRVTDVDLESVMDASSPGFSIKDAAAVQNRVFQPVVARSVYGDNGQIRQIRLYPIDLCYGDKLTRSGVPRRAEDTIANMVLDRIITMSQDRGVAITKVREGRYLIGIATPSSSARTRLDPAIHAADEANRLVVNEGIPFREAYRRNLGRNASSLRITHCGITRERKL